MKTLSGRLPVPLALLAATALAGCTVGPDYQAPETHLAAAWTGPATQGVAEQAGWWKSLNDPLLDALVEEMLVGNPSLREAQARIAEARASRDAVRGGRLPQAQLSSSSNHVSLSENGQLPIGDIPGFERSFSLFDIGFDASWELDFWGRRTRQIEAAEARAQQAELAAQGVRLQLIAELARAYVDLRLAQNEAALAGDAAAAQGRLAELTALLSDAGEANGIDAARAQAQAENAQAALANAQAATRGAALRVAALVGAAPESMLPRLEAPAPIPAPPAAIAAGLPSDLLRRRPDIRVAERDLAASTADVGVATADLFPRFTLGLSIGQQARAIGDLLDGESTRLQAGGSRSWPIFAGGTTRALVRAADARVEQAAARYDEAVIGALADSEAAINRFDRALAALSASTRATERDSAAYDLTAQRRASGEDDALALERARLSLLAAKRSAAEARAAATDAAIGLHKALGGGWAADANPGQS